MSFIIGITGGIGSGKSLVSRILRILGIPVYDCDTRARVLMTGDAQIRSALIRLAGAETYSDNKLLNKAHLANFLFASAENVKQVNAVVHPRVRTDFHQWAANRKDLSIIALESAILYEASFENEADRIWLVSAPLSLRIQRVVNRDASTPEKVMARVNQQWPEALLIERADTTLRNDNQCALLPQVEKALAEIRKNLS